MDLRSEGAITWRQAEAYALWLAQGWVTLSGKASKKRTEILCKLKDREKQLKDPRANPAWSSKKEEIHDKQC